VTDGLINTGIRVGRVCSSVLCQCILSCEFVNRKLMCFVIGPTGSTMKSFFSGQIVC